jgi:23S rRNA pseudouridine955/2504/2580 synthase
MTSTTKTPVRFVTIDPDFQGQRIDNYLVTLLKNVPKSRIYRLLRKGEIRVNKKRVQPSYRLQAEDQLRLPPMELGPEKVTYQPSSNIIALLKQAILFENDNLLIINKPEGIPVHGGSGLQGGVVDVLRLAIDDYQCLELAHRLDRATSGCLILAKKRSILKELHQLFRAGDITKTYHALVLGHWPEDKTIVDLPLQKNQLLSGERMVQVTSEGKESLTYFKPLKYYQAATLVEGRLATGRTHQLRVHTSHSGHPIAGDEKYGDKAFNRMISQLGCKRLFLHAINVSFQLPSTGELINVTAELPKDLQELLEKLGSETEYP